MPIFVNKVEITDDEVHAEMKHHPANSLDDARHQAARALVIRQLLIQEAVRKKLLSPNDFAKVDHEEEAIDNLLNLEVRVPEANDENCQRYYQQNQDRFLHKVSGKQLGFELVKDQIHHYFHARSLMNGISQYIKTLSYQARIVGHDLESSEGPLVQ